MDQPILRYACPNCSTPLPLFHNTDTNITNKCPKCGKQQDGQFDMVGELAMARYLLRETTLLLVDLHKHGVKIPSELAEKEDKLIAILRSYWEKVYGHKQS